MSEVNDAKSMNVNTVILSEFGPGKAKIMKNLPWIKKKFFPWNLAALALKSERS